MALHMTTTTGRHGRSALAILLLLTISGCPNITDSGDDEEEQEEEEEEEQEPIRFRLTILKSGSGGGTVSTSPAGPLFESGTNVTITAVGDTSSAFAGWRRSCADATSNACSLRIEHEDTVTALFYPRSGVRQFDGEYKGMWSGTQSAGNSIDGLITLITVANGAVSGDMAPISGSARTFAATMNEDGTFAAQLAAVPGACGVTFTGTGATVTTTNGIARARLTGTYSLNASLTCNPGAGTWSVDRY